VILNARRRGKKNGRRRNWQTTVSIETTKLLPRRNGAAGIKVIGRSIASGTMGMLNGTEFYRGSAIGEGDQSRKLQRWTHQGQKTSYLQGVTVLCLFAMV